LIAIARKQTIKAIPKFWISFIGDEDSGNPGIVKIGFYCLLSIKSPENYKTRYRKMTSLSYDRQPQNPRFLENKIALVLGVCGSLTKED
jgi:hypothetical protein